MKSKIDTAVGLFIILLFTILVFWIVYLFFYFPTLESIEIISRSNYMLPFEKTSKQKVSSKSSLIKLPSSFKLDIPFICQAPLGNWDSPFDHACEEGAILMAHYYLEGKKSIITEEAAQEICNMVNFEKKRYGIYKDTSSEQTAQLIRDYYGYKVKVFYDISLEDIKKELLRGSPVIVPTAGRLLGNPYFTPPGPIYHMLVIKGYTPKGFITNDPGTRRGENFVYSYQTLERAIHDWNGREMTEENIESGRPAMIVVYSSKNH